MDNKNIVILIPAYNPTNDLIPLTEGLLKNNFNVVVVNDGSKNDANEIFNKLDDKIIFIEHPHNMGKGQALKTGFKYILNNIQCDGVITADADGQHLLSDIMKLAKKLDNSTPCLLLGSRKLDDTTPFKSKFGNKITRGVFKLATGTYVYDTQTGLRGIPFCYLKEFLEIEGQRYEYEINMLIYCAKKKIKMEEITITTVYIDNNKASSFNIVRDSIKIYKCLLKNSSLLQSILFGISGLLSFLIDFILFLLINIFIKNLFNENIALLISILGARAISSLLISILGARAISSLFNFFLNRKIVFQSECNMVMSILKYYLLVILVLIANYLLLNLLTIHLSFNIVLSKILVEVVLFIANYFISKFMIFKDK